LPRASRRLGPASPAELRHLARERSRHRGFASRYFGVHPCANGGWRAVVVKDNRKAGVGSFDSERQAALVRDRLALHLGLSRALLNFPDRRTQPASVEELRRELKATRTAGAHHGNVYRIAGQSSRPWLAHIRVPGGRSLFLGDWATEKDATHAIDRASLYYYGQGVKLRCPRMAARYVPADAATLKVEARREFKSTTTSRYLGVTLRSGAWVATLRHGDRDLYLGRFRREADAARAFDAAALRLRGPRARLNFHPQTGRWLGGRRVLEMARRAPRPVRGPVRPQRQRIRKLSNAVSK